VTDLGVELQAWLRAQVAELLEISAEAVDPSERLRDLGMTSALSAELVAALSTRLGRPIPATLPWQCPTINRMARRLAREEARGDDTTTRSPDRHASAVRSGDDEPVAIIGIGCRFPGGVDSPDSYWRLLTEGVDAITEVPAERWPLDEFYDPDLSSPGKMSTRFGGFLDAVDAFDPAFFGISPREAKEMDPQQRLFLEVAWSCIEDAGVVPSSLKGTGAGVYVGAMWSDYSRLSHSRTEPIVQHTATGQDTSIIAARLSYLLGLEGPSLAVNTACSSSLLAVHLACQSLRLGESQMAIAGGVNLILSPTSTVAMSKFGAMSPDGRCKAFDDRANGYVRGEGCGAVLLKPLSRALADGNRIYALIRGSAVNNDGFSNGLTAPNPDAQVSVLETAWRNAGVDPADVQYVEAHGPGTNLGDPIEAGALGTVFAPGRPVDQPLRIGSVKTNVGHTESAAGIAGLIKVALSMQRRALPASLHYQTPNRHIDFEALRLRVQAALGSWPSGDGPRYAGVSSFGFGGTNCHLALEQPHKSDRVVLPLAASAPSALESLAVERAPEVRQLEGGALSRWCAGAAAAATDRPYRRTFTSSSGADLARQLISASTADGAARRVPDDRPRLVFVCPGYGGQWHGMACELLSTEPAFAAALEACDREIARLAGWSVIEELTSTPTRSNLKQDAVAQPVLFSVEVALAALWASWGVVPDVVTGHSLGEVVAAYLSGALSLHDACSVICSRGQQCRRWRRAVAACAPRRSLLLTPPRLSKRSMSSSTPASSTRQNRRRSPVRWRRWTPPARHWRLVASRPAGSRSATPRTARTWTPS